MNSDTWKAEDIGGDVGQDLLADCQSGATVNRFAADQIISLSALVYRNQAKLISRMTNLVQLTIWFLHFFAGLSSLQKS